MNTYNYICIYTLEIITGIRVVIQPLNFCDTFNYIHTYSHNIIIVVIEIRVLI